MTDLGDSGNDADVPEQVAEGAWIDGDDVIMLPDAILPLVCLRCGQVATKYVAREVIQPRSVFVWALKRVFLSVFCRDRMPTTLVVVPVCVDHLRRPARPKIDSRFAPMISPFFIRFSGAAWAMRAFREENGWTPDE